MSHERYPERPLRYDLVPLEHWENPQPAPHHPPSLRYGEASPPVPCQCPQCVPRYPPQPYHAHPPPQHYPVQPHPPYVIHDPYGQGHYPVEQPRPAPPSVSVPKDWEGMMAHDSGRGINITIQNSNQAEGKRRWSWLYGYYGDNPWAWLILFGFFGLFMAFAFINMTVNSNKPPPWLIETQQPPAPVVEPQRPRFVPQPPPTRIPRQQGRWR